MQSNSTNNMNADLYYSWNVRPFRLSNPQARKQLRAANRSCRKPSSWAFPIDHYYWKADMNWGRIMRNPSRKKLKKAYNRALRELARMERL